MNTRVLGSACTLGISCVIFLAACGPSPSPPAPAASTPPPSGATDGPPALGNVTPASGSGKTQTFTATYSHPDGAKKVVSAFLLVEKTVTGLNACFLEYNSSTNKV